MVLDAFRDLQVKIEDIVAQGDSVAIRATVRGTYEGTPNGVSPIDREVLLGVMTFLRVRSGKIVETWLTAEHLSLLQQLGAVVTRGLSGPTSETH